MALEYTSHGKHFFMQFGMENEHLICVRNIVGHIAPQHTVYSVSTRIGKISAGIISFLMHNNN